MIARRQFLTALFESLDENGVRYCLLRNYDNLYTTADTDVDLLVSHWSLVRFESCLRAAAAANGFRLVHTARYVNYSHVYWHPRLGFTRIDFETDVRWRLFQILDARALLDARVRRGEFFVPEPRHESVILFVAAVWRGFLSERYRRRLAELFDLCNDKPALRRLLDDVFGKAGRDLFELQAHAATQECDRAFYRRVRWSIVVHSHRHLRQFIALLGNFVADVRRLWARLRRSTGVSVLYVSAADREQNFDELIRRIEFLFPAQKCIIKTFDLTRAAPAEARWGPGLRWMRLRTLFKGGLFVRAYRLARDADLLPAVRTHARYLYPSRTIVCVEDSTGQLYFGHVSTGFMAVPRPPSGDEGPDFNQAFIEFISDILERHTAATDDESPPRGLFAVLVGLDGAGKTTLARNVCQLAVSEGRLHGVRYFHWRPGIFRGVEFPLPDFREQPRKPAPSSNTLNTCLSAARLFKNALLANVAYYYRIRPLVRQGYLVLVDRYFYNYLLDPVSVRYSGPPGLLEWMRRFFPRPEMIITLDAPADVLLQRKGELSEAEMRRQAAALKAIKFDGARVIAADARRPAGEVARSVMAEILKMVA